MLSTSVKWIRNDMRGAPVINGNTPGCLIAALDALLVTGWGATTALSVSVSGGIATATVNAGSSFAEHAVVLVEGATPSALNGEARALTASNTQITFATTAPDGVATGAITLKYAPAGWEKVYSSTNKAVYRGTDVTGARFYLRVDDTDGTHARVRGFESMSDVDTGIGPFPSDTLMSGGGSWRKSHAVNATPIPYAIAADSRAVLLVINYGVSSSAAWKVTKVVGFGDPIAANPSGDVWAAFLSENGSGDDLNRGGLSGAVAVSDASALCCFARPWQGLGGSVFAQPLPESGSLTEMSGMCSMFGFGPSVIDGQIKTARMLLKEQPWGSAVRAVVPGVYYIPQDNVYPNFPQSLVAIDGGGPLAGRKLLVLYTGSSSGATSRGVALLDLTGPWR